jgi:DNA repair protein NreA
MTSGKGVYLRQITTSLSTRMKSVEVGYEMEGSSPPSVFIGSHDYPKVYAGPIIAACHGDTRIMDAPESWIPQGISQEEIIRYRLSLVRGKQRVAVNDINNPFVNKLHEIALSSSSVESEVTFETPPAGMMFSDESSPHGPSARMEQFEIERGRWDHDLERVYYDTDLGASGAVIDLHRRGVPFSGIQKAFSVGTMGAGRKRRLVPTRWAITACDTIIGDNLLSRVRQNSLIDCYRVHEFNSLNNHYAVLLIPSVWQYEWIEAFLHVLGQEEMIFADHEGHRKKQGYSPVGGCYYSCRMAVLDALAKEGKQAGAIILREARRGYIPLGVFNVRENVKHAMEASPKEFEGLQDALSYLAKGFTLPSDRFYTASSLLSGLGKGYQVSLSAFC